MMLAFNAFEYQLTSFLGFIAGGGVGLFVALGWRNASQAIFWASLALPFATFFVITSYLLGDYDRVFLVTVGGVRLRGRGDAGAGRVGVRRGAGADGAQRRVSRIGCERLPISCGS